MNIFSRTIHRNILESLLKENLPSLQGEILDIGSKNRRYDSLLSEKPIAIDIVPNKDNDIIFGDMHSLPFENRRFRSVLAIETMEYATRPEQAITEILRVLKQGGTLTMSTPFLVPSHGDYIRFTEKYLREILLYDFSKVTIIPIGNSFTILLDIIRNDFFAIENTFFKYLLSPFFMICMLPTLWMSMKHHTKGRYASGYFIIATK